MRMGPIDHPSGIRGPLGQIIGHFGAQKRDREIGAIDRLLREGHSKRRSPSAFLIPPPPSPYASCCCGGGGLVVSTIVLAFGKPPVDQA